MSFPTGPWPFIPEERSAEERAAELAVMEKHQQDYEKIMNEIHAREAEEELARQMAELVLAAEEGAGEEEAGEEEEKVVKEVVKLPIYHEDVGKFIGKGGSRIKEYVIKQTRDMVKVDVGPLFCQIIKKKEPFAGGIQKKTTYARLKAKDQVVMKMMKLNLEKHVQSFNKMKKYEGQSRFVFKFAMDHFKMGKFVGVGGKNVNEIKETIAQGDESLFDDKVFINIKKDELFKMKNMKFVDLTTEEERDGEVQMVLITVSVYTEDREKSLQVIQGIIEEEVRKVLEDEGEKLRNELEEDEDPFDESGW